MTFITVLGAMALPQVASGIDRSRGLAAARYLAGRMALARARAVSGGASVALRFEDSSRGIGFAVLQDGNRSGVRTNDIAAGIDFEIESTEWLADLFPGVHIAVSPELSENAVQLGGTGLLSFTPSGTATSGSIYVRGRDGTQWSVRVLGATGRTRVLRYLPTKNEWVEAL